MGKFKYVLVDSHRIPEKYFPVEKKLFEKAGIECVFEKANSPEEVLDIAGDADAMGMVHIMMDRAFLEKIPNCKVIVRFGIGVETIDIDAAADLGIMVGNMPAYCQDEVATHALALFLDLLRKTTFHDRNYRSGVFNGGMGYESRRLNTLTMGILGFGSIARRFASYAKALEMKVVAYDPYLPNEVFAQNGAERVTLDELYAISDAISIHTPLTPETEHIINRESIAKMKDGVYLINCSRGGTVKTDDLLDALKSGKVNAAGLDVVENEPIKDLDDPLYKAETVVLTPHSAYNSRESIILQHEIAADTVIRVSNREIPDNIVNKKGLKL
jgi:D-3-phosphoglycerate dehydrogenase